ncbi:MAG: aminotransferase class IV [Pseudomonadota bacterium]
MNDFTKGAGWMNGEIIPIDQAKIGVTDWGLTHSDITYDVVPVWKGAFFRLNDYLDRFEASMASLRMDIGMDRSAIETALHDMVAATGLKDSYCAMVASRGAPMIPGSRDPRECANHFYAWAVPYVYVIKPEVAEKGATLWICRCEHGPGREPGRSVQTNCL